MPGNDRIVERLRSRAEYEDNGGCVDRSLEDVGALLRSAAARIEGLEGALRHYAQESEHDHGGPVWDGGARAREALNTKDQGNG